MAGSSSYICWDHCNKKSILSFPAVITGNRVAAWAGERHRAYACMSGSHHAHVWCLRACRGMSCHLPCVGPVPYSGQALTPASAPPSSSASTYTQACSGHHTGGRMPSIQPTGLHRMSGAAPAALDGTKMTKLLAMSRHTSVKLHTCLASLLFPAAVDPDSARRPLQACSLFRTHHQRGAQKRTTFQPVLNTTAGPSTRAGLSPAPVKCPAVQPRTIHQRPASKHTIQQHLMHPITCTPLGNMLLVSSIGQAHAVNGDSQAIRCIGTAIVLLRQFEEHRWWRTQTGTSRWQEALSRHRTAALLQPHTP